MLLNRKNYQKALRKQQLKDQFSKSMDELKYGQVEDTRELEEIELLKLKEQYHLVPKKNRLERYNVFLNRWLLGMGILFLLVLLIQIFF